MISVNFDCQLTRGEGVLSDATKSVSRAYINNFQDKSKQIAIDMFLVRPVPTLLAFVVLTYAPREISATSNPLRYLTQSMIQFG